MIEAGPLVPDQHRARQCYSQGELRQVKERLRRLRQTAPADQRVDTQSNHRHKAAVVQDYRPPGQQPGGQKIKRALRACVVIPEPPRQDKSEKSEVAQQKVMVQLRSLVKHWRRKGLE
jgi:hypothetical protein